MDIIEITWNWSPALMEGNQNNMECYADTCEAANISDEKVLAISEFEPRFEGDKFFYEITYKDKTFLRVFNPNTVKYK